MKKLIAVLFLLLASSANAQVLTDAYITEIEQNVELLEELIAQGLGTERDEFMLEYYKKKLTEQKASSVGGGNRVAFTTAIDNKEPINNLQVIDRHDSQTIFFFSELKNLQGKRITHRWSFNGNVIYQKGFAVGGSRWRVWTEKAITPFDGVVTVELVDAAGNILQSSSITIR